MRLGTTMPQMNLYYLRCRECNILIADDVNPRCPKCKAGVSYRVSAQGKSLGLEYVTFILTEASVSIFRKYEDQSISDLAYQCKDVIELNELTAEELIVMNSMIRKLWK
jgi:hypothetical protein